MVAPAGHATGFTRPGRESVAHSRSTAGGTPSAGQQVHEPARVRGEATRERQRRGQRIGHDGDHRDEQEPGVLRRRTLWPWYAARHDSPAGLRMSLD